jgi:hypothetical protein
MKTRRGKRNAPAKEWKLVDSFPVSEYRCGAKAGDRVRLRRELVIEDSSGKPTGKVFPSGDVWTVIRGAAEEPRVLWLRTSDQESHTWDDDASFWDWFEKIEE